MPDTDVFLRLLQANYTAAVDHVNPFANTITHDERGVVQVNLADGRRRLLRIYRQDSAMTDWLVGCGAQTVEAWLESRAATLAYLETLNYPAPRVVPTTTGALVGKAEGWCTLITTFVDGTVANADPSRLCGFGAALGKLHQRTLADDNATKPPIGLSG